MKQLIFLNGKQVEVIAYFEFESIRKCFLIYCDQNNSNTIYLGQVIKKEDILELNQIEKIDSFLLKKFIQELIENDFKTIKGYRYFNRLPELVDQFHYIGSQKIVLEEGKKAILEDFVTEINSRNGELLNEAREEYYMQLVDQKAKDRRTIIILLIILFAAIGMIVKMIMDYLH